MHEELATTSTETANTPVEDAIEAIALHIADSALDKKALDLKVLDVRGVVTYADFFVICSGRSDRHVRSVADNVRDEMARIGRKPIGAEGLNHGTWVVLDYGDVVFHGFHIQEREHYGLDRLWSDVPRLDLEIPSDLVTSGHPSAELYDA